MLKISKQEAFEMRKVCGMDLVKKTWTKNPTYFLVEEPWAVKKLKKYRDSKIVK